MSLSFWVVIAPLIAAVLLLVLPKMGGGESRSLSIVGTLVSLVLAIVMWLSFPAGQSGFEFTGQIHWFTLPALWQAANVSVGLSFGVDGLSLPLIAMTAFISVLAMAGAKRSIDRPRIYYFWLSMVTAGLLGVFSALDLFTFLVALEVTLFASFFLIQLFGLPGSPRAAIKFLIYRGFATVAMLVALVGIAYGLTGAYSTSGASSTMTFSIPQMLNLAHHSAGGLFPVAMQGALLLVLLLGVFIEEAFVPFHTWLPTTHEFADTPTNMVVGGLLTKTGAYVLLRFGVGMLPGQIQHYGTLIAVFGVINILYGAFAAWAQKDWRRLIAFGGISHMGLVLLGIASFSAAGLQGAMFMIVSSGLLTALLFFLTGAIEDRTKTVQLKDLGGLSKAMPMISGFLLVAALASLGLPLTSGFISEIQAFIGGFTSYPAVSFVGLGGLILSAVYLLYAIQKTTFGPSAKLAEGLSDATAREYLPTILLTALVLLIGIYPNLIGHLFNLSVQGLLGIGG
ncbi:NADH-quinone oxidoreductase subunit M [Alicyclobacillus curvatus]|jgi:NADH-quinone oxidoreductase subunit M|nr:NADH-quinone oxidoreductase subunit M [Alicyclobacillus curvatus]